MKPLAFHMSWYVYPKVIIHPEDSIIKTIYHINGYIEIWYSVYKVIKYIFWLVVNAKDYPIYYGKNMFETTNQMNIDVIIECNRC